MAFGSTGPIIIMSSEHTEKEQTARAPHFPWGASHDLAEVWRLSLKREIWNCCSHLEETAGLATNRQLGQCKVTQSTNAYDANYACRSHEISVLCHHACIMLIVSSSQMQLFWSKNKHNNIIQNVVSFNITNVVRLSVDTAIKWNQIHLAGVAWIKPC